MPRHRIALTVVSSIPSVLLLAACGSSTDNTADSGAAAPSASSPAVGSTPSAGGEMMATTSMLMTKNTSDMGTIVTDAKGWTLYRYDKDQASPSMSMCTGDCAKTWMPVMAEKSSVHAIGVAQNKVGTVTRSDGMKQLTLAGWPLFRYMGDTKAGDMTGQGKGGAWYAVTPAGARARLAGGASTSKEGASDSGSSMSGMPGM